MGWGECVVSGARLWFLGSSPGGKSNPEGGARKRARGSGSVGMGSGWRCFRKERTSPQKKKLFLFSLSENPICSTHTGPRWSPGLMACPECQSGGDGDSLHFLVLRCGRVLG